ncbi:MAG: CobD/CbiB family cobalamin biosynthesis protein [Desulfurococcaceae archaeon]|nr:MAG: CobD/CbiB family cobalamin biosynthesis protein [Desulfurococcaceae archaeon]
MGIHMIDFLLPAGLFEIVAPILLGLLMDLLYPYHRGLLLKIHPVHTAYTMARLLSPPGSSRVRGVVTWLVVMVVHCTVYGSLLYIARMLGEIFWILVSAYIVKLSVSVRLLVDIVRDVARCLEAGDIACAREKTSWIVRRDTSRLGEGHLASASIESLFESTVDGIASPLLYTALLGPMGGLVQRLINTLDGALGFKTPEYIKAGWLSAKADTIINYIPARLVAIMIIILAPIAGGSIGRALRIYIEYRRKTESVNAGHPMAAAAGGLGIRLEKVGSYVLGEGPLPGYRDIYRALRLFTAVLILVYLVTLVIAASANYLVFHQGLFSR